MNIGGFFFLFLTRGDSCGDKTACHRRKFPGFSLLIDISILIQGNNEILIYNSASLSHIMYEMMTSLLI